MSKTRDKLIDELFDEIIKQSYDIDEETLPSLSTNRRVPFELSKEIIEKSRKGVKIDADLYLY